MPLNTAILRKGKPIIVPWDDQMLSFMYTVAHVEGDPTREYQDGKAYKDIGTVVLEGTDTPHDGRIVERYVDFSMCPIYYLDSKCDLVTKGRQVVKRKHVFFHSSGKLITFKPGDVLSAYRSHKN